MRPHETIDALADALNLKEPAKLLKRVHVPSTSVSQSNDDTKRYLERTSGIDDRSALLSKWRQSGSEQEERKAFEVLHRFGLGLYEFGNDLPPG